MTTTGQPTPRRGAPKSERARVPSPTLMSQRVAPILKALEGGAEVPLTGEEVLREVADLIAVHLPLLRMDDPFRGALATIALAVPSCRRSQAGRRS